MSGSEKSELTEIFRGYPLGQGYRLLDGFDIYRSRDVIMAIVAVEGSYGRDIRFYRWRRKESGWKVDLARSSVKSWKGAEIGEKIEEMKRRFGI